jgi:putative intracellular protease/amidase
VIVTHRVARHDGLGIARGEDPGEAPAFAREHLRRLLA